MNRLASIALRSLRSSAVYLESASSQNLGNSLIYFPVRNLSSYKSNSFNSHYQIDNLRSSEVEFCPTRAKDVLQSAVAETEEECKHDRYDDNTEGKVNEHMLSAEELGDAEHVEAYKAQGSVSLNAVMESNVPEPFSSRGKAPTHLNMPGASWSQEQKYLSEHRQMTHQSRQFSSDTSEQRKAEQQIHGSHQPLSGLHSTTQSVTQNDPSKISQRTKLKMAIRDYGSTVIVFHVGISLMSLGGCYLAVTSGLDVASWLTKIGLSESVLSNSVTVGGSEFLLAYAVHKVFAPVRIGITLTATPIIVRYLRSKGVLKPPKPS